jgi:hypothetical protein
MTAEKCRKSRKFINIDDRMLFVIETDPFATKKETIVIFMVIL